MIITIIVIMSIIVIVILQGVMLTQSTPEHADGQWVKVLSKQQGRHLGGSGMAVQ